MLVENSGGGGGLGGNGGGGSGEGKSTNSANNGTKTGGGVSKMGGGGGGGSRPVATPTRSAPTTNGATTPTRTNATNGFSTPNKTHGSSLSRTPIHITPSRTVNGTTNPRNTNGTSSRGPMTPIRTTSTSHSTSTNRSTTSSNISSAGSSKNATPTKSLSGDLDNQLSYTPPHVLIRSISSLSQHSLRPSTPDLDQEDGVVSVPALRKGVLLQARDRLFSRWKERYFVLTRDYLACFRRGSTKYSEMGSFIFKVEYSS
ncbi:hypothetical protein SK128_014155 [Halocaridina rubra]|uniref:PH domain-containing protein n=1 Tax=Halocaridina rubra TaxID=373956 RepID=A0AAN8ZU11_HALRR